MQSAFIFWWNFEKTATSKHELHILLTFIDFLIGLRFGIYLRIEVFQIFFSKHRTIHRSIQSQIFHIK